MKDGVELFDALDSKGAPTGKLKTKTQIFDDGDWRSVIHIWLLNPGGRLLVQKRAHKGIWNDLWDVSVGGGVSAGEDPKNAAVRELNEELSIKVEETDLKHLGRWETSKTIHERQQVGREFSDTYLLQKDIDLSKIKLQVEEVVAVEWLTLDKLRLAITDDKEYKKWVPHPKSYYLGVLEVLKEQELV